MKHLGDITKLHGWEIPPVDCITGGSPCQDLSLAGKRAGLVGERSGLFMEQIRLIKEMRDATRVTSLHGRGIKPKYMVWENVCGAFSSNGGKDFKAVLEETIRIAEPEAPDVPMPGGGGWPKAGCLYDQMGKWSVAWRLHDAQFWGVPQRRKRIALVADFGGLSAPEVLFERKGLSWYSAESGEQGQGSAGNPADSIGTTISFQERAGKPGGGKGILIQEDSVCSIRTQQNQSVLALEGNGSRPSHHGDGYSKEGDPMFTLNTTETHAVATTNFKADGAEGDGRAFAVVGDHENRPTDMTNLVVKPMVLESNQNHATAKETEVCPALKVAMGEGGGHIPMVASWDGSQISHTLTANSDNQRMPDKDNFNAVIETYHCTTEEDKALTLKARDYKDPQCVYGIGRPAYNQGYKAQFSFSVEEEMAPTQVAQGPGAVATHTVRRLTPLECERLQGFPSEIKVDVSKMTKDEYIAWNLAEKNIVVDAEKGKVFATRGPGGLPYKEPKELQGTILNGYKVVSIRNGATKLQCRVHRIVWISKHGIIPDGYVVDHINNDKQDNRISNLQILTQEDNSHKAKEDGLYKEGLDNPITKLDPDLKDEIAFLYAYSEATMRDLAKLYGVSKSRIHQIIHEVGWTDIGEWTDSKGKVHESSDSARYKALGNSIAVGYANRQSGFWMNLMKRISAQYERSATLGSLFDGIGGFPLAWEFYNGKGSAIWASEIEEFPIAVTKKRFGE